MNRLRDPKWALIYIFLGLLGVVPMAQLVKEALTDDGIIAFDVLGEWPTAQHLRSYENRMEKASWLGSVTRPWLQFANFSLLKEGGDKVAIGLDGWYFFKPGLKYTLARREASAAHNPSDDAVAAIIDFRNQLAARGIHLLLMPVPNKESIYPDKLARSARIPTEITAPLTREVMDRLRAANVEIVNLFNEFGSARARDGASSAPPVYLSQDTHWSPSGVQLAAKIAARRLIQLGWIQRGSYNYREEFAPVHRVGDLLGMLQAPAIQRTVPPEAVRTVQVLTQTSNQPYKDEAIAEVLVIGDSFMRIYQQDAPTSAGFIAHLAKELGQPMMSVINDGGGATIVREELCARPIFLQNKRVVLWEFVERDLGLAVKGWPRTPLPPATSAGR